MIAVSKLIQGIIDVLQVLILLATLAWATVKKANSLKEYHGEDSGWLLGS